MICAGIHEGVVRSSRSMSNCRGSFSESFGTFVLTSQSYAEHIARLYRRDIETMKVALEWTHIVGITLPLYNAMPLPILRVDKLKKRNPSILGRRYTA